MQGILQMSQLLGHQRGLALPCRGARKPFRAFAAAKSSEDAASVKSARLSRILRQYEEAGWWWCCAAAATAAATAAAASHPNGQPAGSLAPPNLREQH